MSHLRSQARVPSVDRIVVTGARGQLGQQLCHQLGSRAIPLDVDTMDLTDPAQIRARLLQLRPQLLINCAAYTAVDAAETDAARCLSINRDAVETLVEVTRELDCALVQISTDYVFCGSPWPGRPFQETDPIAPLGVYAQSKADAEQRVQTHPHHVIVRSCGLYGPTPAIGSGNFVNTMLRLGRERKTLRVVDDQTCCPTYVVELAEGILHLAATGREGVFHVVNPHAVTWCEFAREIFRLASISCEVVPITTEEYGAAAPRPRNSSLDIARFVATDGPDMSTCKNAVAAYLGTCGDRRS